LKSLKGEADLFELRPKQGAGEVRPIYVRLGDRFVVLAIAAQKSQRALAERLGVSQPRIVKLESGEHNPEIDTIINAVRRLGIEFVLDVSPADRKPTLVTARAQRKGAIAHDDVSVVAASSLAT
jgi:transcriptional regulator with XRE-family HTH domain